MNIVFWALVIIGAVFLWLALSSWFWQIGDFLSDLWNDAKEYGIEVIDASIIDVHPDSQLQQTIDDRVKAM